MLVQVLGTVFRLMETHADRWQPVRGSEPVPIVGFRYDVGLDPIKVNPARMIDHFRRGVRDLESVWQTMFTRAESQQLRRGRARADADFVIGDELWARLVYDLAAAYHHRVRERDALVRATLPLYMGRVASFVMEMADADAAAGGGADRAAVRDLRAGEGLSARRWATAAAGRRASRGSAGHEQGRMTCGKWFNRCWRRPGSSSRAQSLALLPNVLASLLFLAIGAVLAVLAGRVAKFLLRRSAVERRATRLGLTSWLERAGILSATAVVVRLVQVVFALDDGGARAVFARCGAGVRSDQAVLPVPPGPGGRRRASSSSASWRPASSRAAC